MDDTRIHALDVFKGIVVIPMVLYHGLYLFLSLYFDINLIPFGIIKYLALPVVGTFMITAGITSKISRNNLKRGVKLLIVAYLITFLTTFIPTLLPSLLNDAASLGIRFGILHFFGWVILLYAVLSPHIKRSPALFEKFPYIFLLLFALLFFIFPIQVNTPHLYMFGFINESFSSADYYPILPWVFLFLFGIFISDKIILQKKAPEWFYTMRCAPLEFLGKYCLFIYVLHQLVILAVFKFFEYIFLLF